ncbi:zonular occludens toxin [Acinetobacter wuhouensis]|uniref:zonular occludens toxin domain-containing protein n=1 Tax=Acinetobacter wuhouensis TaxID=1879050 RepID=UPI001023D1B6|nr:zonular occludens toxin domain-containing protein [Acinetobacter wuhouensis]RZG66681.1 zonular occludens toxin [Acinetobacter wuhouensis]
MLYAHIGKPGQGKSYTCVVDIYETQQINNHNVKKNVQIYYENKQILLDRDYDLDKNSKYTFPRMMREKGEKEDKLVDFTFTLSDLTRFEDEEQFEYYFELFLLFNDFIQHINTLHSINLAKLLPVHQIYCDINGLAIEGVLVPPIDWRETPRGSIIYYDEIRRKSPYNFTSKTPSKDPIILEMSEVRHHDKDVHLISQDAEDLNVSLRGLIDKLYFYKRPPQNINACSVYTFDQWLARPRAAADSKRDPKKYVDYRLVTYKKKFYKLYKSASSHTSMKINISWRVFFYIFIFILTGLLVTIGFLKIPIFQYFGSAIKQMTGQGGSVTSLASGQLPSSPNNSETKSSTETATSPYTDLSVECRKGINVEKPECVQWFDQLSKNKESIDENGKIEVSYNPNAPYNLADIQKTIRYEVTSKPIFSGCMKQNGRYVAYTQQGTILNEVSQSDCQKLMNGDRPFNYFAKYQADNNANFNNQINPQNNYQPPNQRPVLQEITQANNYVEPNLERSPVNGANAL